MIIGGGLFFSIGCSNERRHLERRTQIQMKIAIAGAGLQKFSAGGTGCRVGKHVESRIALLAPLRKSTVHAFFLCDLVDGLKPLSRIFFEQENVLEKYCVKELGFTRIQPCCGQNSHLSMIDCRFFSLESAYRSVIFKR